MMNFIKRNIDLIFITMVVTFVVIAMILLIVSALIESKIILFISVVLECSMMVFSLLWLVKEMWKNFKS